LCRRLKDIKMKKKVRFWSSRSPLLTVSLSVCPSGASHGKEWFGKDEYAVHHIRQLHRQRHAKTRRHK